MKKGGQKMSYLQSYNRSRKQGREKPQEEKKTTGDHQNNII